MIKSSSLVLTEKEFFSVRLEYNEEFAIMHLPRVDKMTKEVFLDMKFYLEDLWKFFKAVGYKALHLAIDPNNTKIKKLVDKLEFKYLGSADGMDVYQYDEELT